MKKQMMSSCDRCNGKDSIRGFHHFLLKKIQVIFGESHRDICGLCAQTLFERIEDAYDGWNDLPWDKARDENEDNK